MKRKMLLDAAHIGLLVLVQVQEPGCLGTPDFPELRSFRVCPGTGQEREPGTPRNGGDILSVL